MDREQQRQQKPAVLITGAAGNIGQTLARALADDYRIIGLDRSPADVVDHAYEADITSADSVTEAFNKIAEEQGKNLAAVIHLAAYFDFTGEDSPLYEQVNLQGTRHLLHALAPFTIERFIYSSTMLVHQPGSPGDKITESTPLEPRWAYPQSKADVEALIEKEVGPTPYTILRLAGVYDEHTAVPTLAHQIARIYELDVKSKVYAGDTAAGQAFLHKQDMVAAFKRTLEKRQQLPQRHALLIGESECLSYAELQNRIGELIHHQRKWRTLSLPTPVAKVGAWLQEKTEPLVPDDFDHGEKPFIRPFMIDMASDHYDLDISAAHTQLDWQPKFSLYITLEKLVANLKADAAQWYAANRITPPTWLTEASELHKDPNKVLGIHQQRYQREHQNNLWGSFIIMGLGAWLITAPPVMNYTGTLMAISDLITGLALIIFALFALSWQNGWARWVNAILGLWLLAAPLIFWTNNATAYLNSTLVGILVIGLSVLLRPAPGISPLAAVTGPTIPPGWDRTPSSWLQRIPIIFLAFIGFFISRYLTAYQLGHIESVWDPFFSSDNQKNGTEFIITSSLSEAWPVPDAGLGAMVYAMEILVGLIGSNRRWRTMPWLVTLFGVLIVPLGIVSITFIIIQPILLGTWCTLCLLGAAAMLIQIPYSLDELLATAQFLKRQHAQGKPVLKIFFTGGTDEGDQRPYSSKQEFSQSRHAIINETLAGSMALPWNLVLCVVLGIWLMLTRVTLGHTGAMANWDHLIGALVITIAVFSFAEVSRSLRFLIVPLAVLLGLVGVIYAPTALSVIAALGCALALILLCLPRGKIDSQFGSWHGNRY
jgi:nucleoside-diphosphate-sugar epimerase/uncharacterized membrane protein